MKLKSVNNAINWSAPGENRITSEGTYAFHGLCKALRAWLRHLCLLVGTELHRIELIRGRHPFLNRIIALFLGFSDTSDMILTPRQARFIDEFLVDHCATQAAIRAGYSARTAKVQGCRLLTKANVAAAISLADKAQQERVQIRADDVLRELRRVAFANLGDASDEKGALLPISAMPEDLRRAIQSLETSVRLSPTGEPVIIRRLRLCDKLAALTLLGKHLGLWKERVEVTNKNLAERLKRAQERVRRREVLPVSASGDVDKIC